MLRLIISAIFLALLLSACQRQMTNYAGAEPDKESPNYNYHLDPNRSK